jgi:hypothetical protein
MFDEARRRVKHEITQSSVEASDPRGIREVARDIDYSEKH